MHGYDSSSYGDGFADVYDDWYGDISDVEATVVTLTSLVPAGRSPSAVGGSSTVVELGVGTGRIAIPLAVAVPHAAVWGIDASEAMLARAAAKVPPANLFLHRGDMVADLLTICPGEPLGLVFVAFNTFFNLASEGLQQRCFRAVADRLADDGSFVIEAFVPDEPARRGDHVEVKALEADRVILSITRYDGRQLVEGQFVELSEAGGVRLRPWSIRYLSPGEMDRMADAAGLELGDRWETFAREPFTDDSNRHVSVYRRRRGA